MTKGAGGGEQAQARAHLEVLAHAELGVPLHGRRRRCGGVHRRQPSRHVRVPPPTHPHGRVIHVDAPAVAARRKTGLRVRREHVGMPLERAEHTRRHLTCKMCVTSREHDSVP